MAKPTTICAVRMGSLSVPITQYADGRYCASVTGLETGRRRITSVDLDHVKAETERVLCQILKGDTDAAELPGRDARIHVAARDALAGLRIEVDQAARLVAELAGILGDPQRAVEAARFFIAAHPSAHGAAPATFGDVLKAFLFAKETAQGNGDIGEMHMTNLREDLGKFAAAFGEQKITLMRATDIEGWLNSRKKRDGAPLGKRRRRHLRDRIAALFIYAAENGYLPRNVKTEAEKVVRPKIKRGKQPSFTPAEFRLLLATAPERLIPALAIGGFAGMRASEIARLDWSAINLEKGQIDVSSDVAGKTGDPRIIELLPHQENLITWLRPHQKECGPVLDPAITRIDNLLRRGAQKAGLKWKQNVLRGSCASYLFALTSDLGFVARQLGNSGGTLRREYLAAKTAEDAKAWYGIVPEKTPENVLNLTWNVA